MRQRIRDRVNSQNETGDILRRGPGGAPWPFVEGSISVTASILAADALASCDQCRSWPVIGFFKKLTEQEDGVIIAGMALLFPTALGFYLGGKMVFSAYYESKRRYQEHQARRAALMEEMREKGARGRPGRRPGRRPQSRTLPTKKREFAEKGISLSPEAESVLFGGKRRTVLTPLATFRATRLGSADYAMPTFQAPRGTADRLPTEQKYWRYIESHATDVARRFGYGRIDSPMFEDARLFVRGVGEGTDIVEKEMYVFEDRGGDHLTLRAEGTAPVCRAYLEHGMHNQAQPVRMYYLCPVFRYERPQAGRFRQHHQFGVEAIGDGDPSVDAEVIELGWTFMHDIGLSDITLLTNSIGDGQCRPEYIAALKSYYQGQTANLCPDCRQRLERNPLRLLDCKVETCPAPWARKRPSRWNACARSARPTGTECVPTWTRPGYPTEWTTGWFGVWIPTPAPCSRSSRRSRGAQSTILGGGRYDGLIEQLGGRPTPGIGFGSGIERLALNLRRDEIPVP